MNTEIPDSRLLDEVRSLILRSIEAGRSVKQAAVIQEWVDGHPGISGTDRDTYVRCAFEHGRDLCRRALREFDDDPDKSSKRNDQLTLPGFERMRIAYRIDRNGDEIIVPTPKVTDEELLDKARMYDTMATGLSEHAQEIRRYVKQRKRAQNN